MTTKGLSTDADSGLYLEIRSEIVKRVPRYELFLERLIKATPEEHVDFANLQKSLVKIKQTSAHINSFVKEAENKQKIVALQKLLNMELVEPHRYCKYISCALILTLKGFTLQVFCSENSLMFRYL